MGFPCETYYEGLKRVEQLPTKDRYLSNSGTFINLKIKK